MVVVFEKIVRESIFQDNFSDFKEHNILEFDGNNVVVLYGPNGTGKSSLAAVLSQDQEVIEYSLTVDGTRSTHEDVKVVHVISDQNGRNIIEGSTEDFILGDNIRREYELKNSIEEGFNTLFRQRLSNDFKQKFGISTVKTLFSDVIKDEHLKSFISDIANNKSKGDKLDRSDYIRVVKGLSPIPVPDHDSVKFGAFVIDYSGKDSTIRNFLALQVQLLKEEPQFTKIDETKTAVQVLEQFAYLNDCVVCDTLEIDRASLLEKKKHLHKQSYESLSDVTKAFLEGIVEKVSGDDPFGIRAALLETVRTGETTRIGIAKTEIEKYKEVFNSLINNLFASSFDNGDLLSDFDEYEHLKKEQPRFEAEDIRFIEKFLNDCLERKISLSRDSENNLTLLLGDDQFLNEDRKKLSLSNGEQNFLSLAFELLKAKKVSESLIVIDDPISSFDSIYKNKIAYAILKILEHKKTILLTHSTDLIKLVEHQRPDSFRLYYLNNTPNEVNGFIYLNKDELKILMYIHEFTNLLRRDIASEVLNERQFLISVVPFMRGYCQIVNDVDARDQLTKVMHGYEEIKVNISQIYNRLFGPVIQMEHLVSAKDIIALDIDSLSIIKNERFPLLSKTLIHTTTYLYLRLNVESVLVNKFSIDTKKYSMLASIINSAFKGDSDKSIEERVFFLSRKTLLNEFNHFEMDMNIFQPAIDITNSTLLKERNEILQRLAML